MKKSKKKRFAVVATCLIIAVCIFGVFNSKVETKLFAFAAQILKSFSDVGKEVIDTWDISASSNSNVVATLYGDGRLVISGTGHMKSSANNEWETYKEEIKSVVIQEGIENIASNAFKECNNLVNVELPESITYMGYNVFYNCNNLASINIPSKLTSIGSYAFYNCSSLATINIPDNVTTIYQNAFFGCSSLTSINIPSGVTEIGRELIVMNGVVKINEYGVFYGCTSLESINVEADNTQYSSIDGILFNKDQTEIICYPAGKKETEYSIPEGVVKIRSGAFDRCTNLKSIDIPSSVISVGGSAVDIDGDMIGSAAATIDLIVTAPFLQCDNLESINVDANNDIYSSIDGILFNKEQTKIIRYPAGKKDIAQYNIASSVTNVENTAFYECTGLSYIEVPEGATIGGFAFAKCTGLTGINLPESMKAGTGILAGAELTLEVEDTDSQEVMPEILSRVLNSEDILYSESELELVNCEWNDSKETLKINGMTAEIKINDGVLVGLTVTINVIEHIETEAPTINSVTGNATEWTNQNVTLVIDATDSDSGIATENGYSFDNGETWQTANAKTYEENTNGIIIKVKDNVGNIATYEQTINIDKIDKTNPTAETLTMKLDGAEGTEDYINDTWTEHDVYIALSNDAQDEESGIKEVIYTVNGGEPTKEPQTLTESGEYEIVVTTTDNAENTATNSYTIKIKKPVLEEEPMIEISSEKYSINDLYIAKVQAKTTAKEFKENLTTNVTSSNIKIYNEGQEALTDDDVVATGMKIELTLGAQTKTFEISVIGDVDGDGEIKLADMSIANRFRLKKTTLDEVYLLAADVTGDGNVDFKDLVKINRFRLHKITD